MKERCLILLQPNQNPERWEEVGWMSPQKSILSLSLQTHLLVGNNKHFGLSGITLFEYVMHFCL